MSGRTVRVGAVLPGVGDPGRDAAGFERDGYDYVACGEHLFFHGPAPNAFVSLAAAAGATTRVRLVSTVTLLPLYPPVLAAKMAAALDVASGGRFDFGIGVGGEFPPEFAAVSVPLAQRGARTDEALTIVDALLRGRSLRHEDRFFSLGELPALAPAPVQRPRPPLWVGGRKPAALRRAGRWADVWLGLFQTPESFRRGLDTVRDSALAHGRPADQVAGGLFIWVNLGEPGAARQEAADAAGGVYRQDFAPIVDRYLAVGSADTCARRLAEYVDAGAERLVVNFACPPQRVPAMATRFAAEVLPLLRSR